MQRGYSLVHARLRGRTIILCLSAAAAPPTTWRRARRGRGCMGPGHARDHARGTSRRPPARGTRPDAEHHVPRQPVQRPLLHHASSFVWWGAPARPAGGGSGRDESAAAYGATEDYTSGSKWPNPARAPFAMGSCPRCMAPQSYREKGRRWTRHLHFTRGR